jgi:hypothetical protein
MHIVDPVAACRETARTEALILIIHVGIPHAVFALVPALINHFPTQHTTENKRVNG